MAPLAGLFGIIAGIANLVGTSLVLLLLPLAVVAMVIIALNVLGVLMPFFFFVPPLAVRAGLAIESLRRQLFPAERSERLRSRCP